jgi:hypothetical protein
MIPADAIEAGKAAWARLKDRDRLNWADWILIGHALQIGRDQSMKAAGCNTPFGKKYTHAIGVWLIENGLDGIGQQVRWRLLQCMESLPAIERWRAGLDETRRNRIAHPDSIWMHFQRDAKGHTAKSPAQRASVQRNRSGKAFSGGYFPAVRFSGDMIRRAAVAMRESWCNDTFKMAAIALQAAIRNQQDLLELLPPDPPAKSSPPRRSIEKTSPSHQAHAA